MLSPAIGLTCEDTTRKDVIHIVSNQIDSLPRAVTVKGMNWGYTDRSKAVVPVLFLIYILCSFVVYTTRRLMFSSLLVLFVLVSPVCFGFLITSLGEEGAGLCASHTFVCLFCACMFECQELKCFKTQRFIFFLARNSFDRLYLKFVTSFLVTINK